MTTDNTPVLHTVVLAAGASRRYGSPKQLARWAGQTLLEGATARALALGAGPVTVVLGCGAAQLAPLLRRSAASVRINRDWEEGMASSLRLVANDVDGQCDGLLVTLVDQPAVTVVDLQRLQEVWMSRSGSIVAAAYSGTVGVPAIFPASCLVQLGALRGDAGARTVLQRHLDSLLRVPMPAAEWDIDHPEDLQALAQSP
jgi:molybdenum cofactor cytidylyltransferase